MKKKLLSLALAAVMMMSLSATAFAATSNYEDGYVDELTVSVNKSTTAENGTAPSETLSFTVEEGSFTPYNNESTTATVPAIENFTIDTTNGKGSATITLPTVDQFTALGTYTYTISETAGSQAGMAYDTTTYTMTISIILNDAGEKIRVVSIVNTTTNGKVDEEDSSESAFGFTNTYTANSLSVKKLVAGNMADDSKEFSFTVTFANETDGKTWTEAIGHEEEQGDSSYEKETNDDGSVTYTFTLSDEDTVSFTNIPSGITYTVSEDPDGYTSSLTNNTTSSTTTGEAVSITVTNTLDDEVPTGVNLDSLPYVMILAVVALGAVYVISRRRLSDK